MSKILVTGGLGYIGSHVVVELLESGYEVVVIDNLSNSKIEVLDGIYNITGIKPLFENVDLRDEKKLNEFFKNNNKIDGIIHFAALKAVGDSGKNPLLYYENNVNSLINLLKKSNEYSTDNFIFSSSATVYDESDQLPFTEEHKTQTPSSPYAMTKIMGETIIKDLCVTNKVFNTIVLRYFNPIGAHSTAKIGELPLGEPKNLVPFITQSAVGKKGKLKVFGNNYNTKDGTCLRDYIHVVDLAKAHLVSLERLLHKKNKENFEIYNIGTGQGSSVLEVINVFEQITGQKLDYEIAARREGDVAISFADCQKANIELGWRAKRSLKESLQSAWIWETKINQIESFK